MGLCTHRGMCSRGVDGVCVPLSLPTLFLRQDLSLNLDLTNGLNEQASELPGSSCPHLSELWSQCVLPCPAFNSGVGEILALMFAQQALYSDNPQAPDNLSSPLSWPKQSNKHGCLHLKCTGQLSLPSH